MNEKDLSRTLLNQAITLGLCQPWQQSWGTPDQQGLIDKWLHGIDFAIKHNYPTNTFIKENFDKDILHKNGIFVDEDVQKRNIPQIAVLNGNCKGTLLFDGFSVCDVYVRHDSEVTIDCSQYCKVFINVYDRAKVNVIQKDIASVYVYIHGEDCVVETDGDVMQRKSQA
jgi:hypothetical protein|nr:MAG TPA: hypothetical protein [Caudoviricetes sp.]